MMVCGILSEPFCGVCADACRPSWCHSALCLHTRKASVTQLSRQPSQFPLHHVCLSEYHYIPEELTVAMDEILDELMGEVMYEVLDEVIEEVIDENPKPMTCEEFLEVLRPHFDFLFPNYQDAIFDENGRCHSRYFPDEHLYAFLILHHDWGFHDCRQFVDEVLGVVQEATALGVGKAFPIWGGDGDLGSSQYFPLLPG